MIIFGLRIDGMTYKIATALAALVLVSAGMLIWYVIGAPTWNPNREFSVTVTPDWALSPENDARVQLDPMERVLPIALLTFFVSAIGTALAVIFGWRAERQQNKELQLRVLQLESRIAQGHQGNEKAS